MNKKLMMNIQNIINYKGYAGDILLHKDLKDFVIGVTPGKKGVYIFDLFKQLNALYRVFFLLNSLRFWEQPILFFGLNEKNYKGVHKSQVSYINKKIFDLTISNKGLDKELFNKFFDNFYLRFYRENFFLNKKRQKFDEVYIVNSFVKYNETLDSISKTKIINVNGFFFDNWEDSFLTNFHTLRSYLNYCIKDTFLKEKKFKNTLGKDTDFLSSFLKKFRNFFYLSKFLGKKTNDNFPGAAIFFSKEGYENLFLLLNKLGIPVICVVNSSESLQGVDYPLFGNSSYFDTIIFYQKILKKILVSTNKKKY